MARAVLLVQHQDICPPAWVGTWLQQAGVTLQVSRPYAGDVLPGELTAYRGLVVLGGTMGANDNASVPWLAATKELIRIAAGEQVPTLGICLGHQLAAVALGGVVAPDPGGKTVGMQAVGWTAAAAEDRLVGSLLAPGAAAAQGNVGVQENVAVQGNAAAQQSVAVQWNNDIVVEPPPGSVTLARTETGRLQAARFAPTVWGVQWHPEADSSVVRGWAARDRPTAAERGLDVDAAVAGVAANEPLLRRTWRPLVECFVALCADER